MHVKGMLSLGAASLAAIALVSSSGAGTAASRGTARIDLSTRAAVVHYLRAIHVNPRGVVIQRGARNYAGPNCPGKGWTCTSTAHLVVQVASAGGKNLFTCAAASCTVVQAAQATAAANTAKCVKTNGISQSCSINQVSATADNIAIVYMNVLKTTGLTQDASQVANIVQQATGGSTVHNNNRACVTEFMKVDTSTVAARGMPVFATLDGHQTLNVKQDSRYGNNTATESANSSSGGSCAAFDATHQTITQLQIIKQTATGAARIQQDENTHPQGANLSLDIEQNKNGGGLGPDNTNDAVFFQDNTLTAIAKTPTGDVHQTQSTANGGLLADVNQFAHGHSNADAHQTEIQCQHGTSNGQLTCTPGNAVYDQTQYGPVRKTPGNSSQTGNEDCTPTCDLFTVTQGSTQDNDSHSGQTNLVQGGFSTDGSGSVEQTTTVDGETTRNAQAGQNVDTTTNCTGSDCNTTCTGDTCTTFTDNGPQLTATNVDLREFGYGGMRGNGTGSITVSGVTGLVNRAILYWNGPTNSSDPTANAHVTFNGTAVTGTNTGFASSNCWPYANSQSYQADVTGLVTGDGTYSLSNFDVPPDVEINGVSLVVFHNDTDTSNDRNVTLWSGNDSTFGSTFEPGGWDETLTGVQYPGSGVAFLDYIVSDGQYDGTPTFQDGEIDVNSFLFEPQGDNFSGNTTPAGSFNSNGSLWDVRSSGGLESFLVAGSNTVHVTSPHFSDCLSLVALAANTPASAPVIVAPSGKPHLQTRAPATAAPAAPVTGVPSGGATARR